MEKRKLTLTVQGMSCSHCKKAVEKAVDTLAGVSDVGVDLEKGLVTVSVDPQKDLAVEISKAIEDAGYSVVEVH
jgi:copper chaperone